MAMEAIELITVEKSVRAEGKGKVVWASHMNFVTPEEVGCSSSG